MLRLDKSHRAFDRLIDRADDELHRQHGRCRGNRTGYRRAGQADRAEIVGVALVGLARSVVAVVSRYEGRQYSGGMPEAPAVDRVNVTEGQGKVDGERD